MSTSGEPEPEAQEPPPVDPRTVHITLEVQDIIQTSRGTVVPPQPKED